MAESGTIIVLNGAPRSGKSSIASEILHRRPGWLADGVDADMATTPPEHLPGIGLRPGGERPDLEPVVRDRLASLYTRVAAASRAGTGIVVDVGHHDDYTAPLDTLQLAARALDGLPAWLIGVRCPVETILERRERDGYPTEGPAIDRWQTAVHDPGIYDFDVDTSLATASECAEQILEHVGRGQPTAWADLRSRS